MEKFKNFAINKPFMFGLVLILIFSIVGTLTFPVHYLFPETEAGQLLGDALNKCLLFLVFLFIFWKFGWLKESGLARVGKPLIWLVIAPLLVYKVLSWLYAFTGDLSFPMIKLELVSSHLMMHLGTSLVEETIVRGLVLTAMITAWGDTKSGQFKSVVLSSVYFGMIHLFNIIIRPPGVVILQALILSLPGIIYAALVLKYKTLWPGIIMHWLTNAAVNIKLIGVDIYQETLPMWLTAAAVTLPLVILSIYWVWKLPENESSEPIMESRSTGT